MRFTSSQDALLIAQAARLSRVHARDRGCQADIRNATLIIRGCATVRRLPCHSRAGADPVKLMNEHRSTRRQRVLKSGKIIYANGSIVIDCTICNLSGTGARLQVTSVAIPDRFEFSETMSGPHPLRIGRSLMRMSTTNANPHRQEIPRTNSPKTKLRNPALKGP